MSEGEQYLADQFQYGGLLWGGEDVLSGCGFDVFCEGGGAFSCSVAFESV